jgi:CheY-like chemotaxis protein
MTGDPRPSTTSAATRNDRQVLELMAPHLQRILVVDPSPLAVRIVQEVMRDVCRSNITWAATVEDGLRQAATCEPQVIFVELQAGLDGLAFTRRLRRGDLDCRKAPVVVTTSEATAEGIKSARDAGVHEFLRKPFSAKDLLRRLEAVTLRSRDWVEGIGYVGPDRRRFNSGDYTGALKRGGDGDATPDRAKLSQALRILKAAVNAVDRDPKQALRAMLAQADEIREVAESRMDENLAMAAHELQRYLRLAQEKGFNRSAVAAHLEPLTSRLDAKRRTAA